MASSLEIVASFRDQASAGLAKLNQAVDQVGKGGDRAGALLGGFARDGLQRVVVASPIAANGLALMIAELTRYRTAATVAAPVTRGLSDTMLELGGSSVKAGASVGLAARAMAVLPTVATSGAAGLVALGAALIGAAAKAADTQEKLDNLAVQAGLSVEALQALGAVARQNGGDLDALVPAFGKLNAAIAEINKGNFAAEKSFQGFGVSLTDLVASGKSTEQIFGVLAQRFVAMTDAQQKAAAQVDAFGAKNRAIAAVLQSVGEEGIDPLVKRMEALGVVSSKAAQDAARAFDKEADAAKTALGGVVTQVENFAATTVVDFGKGVGRVITEIGALAAAALAQVGLVDAMAKHIRFGPSVAMDPRTGLPALPGLAGSPIPPPTASTQPGLSPDRDERRGGGVRPAGARLGTRSASVGPAEAPDDGAAAARVAEAIAKTQAEITRLTRAGALERQQIEAEAAHEVTRALELAHQRRVATAEAERDAALKAADQVAGGARLQAAAREKAHTEADEKIRTSRAQLAADEVRLAEAGARAAEAAAQRRVQAEASVAAARTRRAGNPGSAIDQEAQAAIAAVQARLDAELKASEQSLGATAAAIEQRTELERAAAAEIVAITESAVAERIRTDHELQQAALDRLNRVKAAEAETETARADTTLARIDAETRLRVVQLERLGLVRDAELVRAQAALKAIGVETQRETARLDAGRAILANEQATLQAILQTTENVQDQMALYARLAEISEALAQSDERRAQAAAQASAATAEAQQRVEDAGTTAEPAKPGDQTSKAVSVTGASQESIKQATLQSLLSGRESVEEVRAQIRSIETNLVRAFGNLEATARGMQEALAAYHAATAKATGTIDRTGDAFERITAATHAAAEAQFARDQATLTRAQLDLEEKTLRLRQRGLSDEEIDQRLRRERAQVERDSVALRLREIELTKQQMAAQEAATAALVRFQAVLERLGTVGGREGSIQDFSSPADTQAALADYTRRAA